MKINKILLAALGLSLVSPFAAEAARVRDVAVTAAMDSTEMLMGSVTELNVRVKLPRAFADSVAYIGFPDPAANPESFVSVGGVDYNSLVRDTVSAEGTVTYGFKYKVQAFNPCDTIIGPFAVALPTGDTVRSQVLPLRVYAVDVDTTTMALMPSDGVARPNTRWHDYIPMWVVWALSGLILVAIAVILIVLLRKNKLQTLIRRKPVVPPYELAMQGLNALQSKRMAASGHDKEYYTELVDILRRYLQGRFGINAMEMTSTQIMKALKSNSETRLPAERMNDVLRVADFVKFAKERPQVQDNERALADAFDFVESTKPQPEPEPDQTNTKAGKKKK